MNRWALWVSGWPGAQIYFDTACAALVCLLLLGLGWLAYHCVSGRGWHCPVWC